jgi:hypothetical protein
LDAALVLVLANHIGDIDVLSEAIILAKRRMLDGQAATAIGDLNTQIGDLNTQG